MTAHLWAEVIGNLAFWLDNAWSVAGLAMVFGWPKRGVLYAVFHEIRPFYLTLVAVGYVATVVADGHVINVAAGLTAGGQLLNWYLFRNAGGDDDRWKRRGRRVAEQVAQAGSRLTVVPAGSPS